MSMLALNCDSSINQKYCMFNMLCVYEPKCVEDDSVLAMFCVQGLKIKEILRLFTASKHVFNTK